MHVAVLVPGVAILIVHLDPQHDLCHQCNHEIRIPIQKIPYKHVLHACLEKMNITTPCPGPWGCRSRCSP